MIAPRFADYTLLPAAALGPLPVRMADDYRLEHRRRSEDWRFWVRCDALAQDPERLARFEREAKVLAALNHPSIAHIYGVEESGGVRGRVMELAPGAQLLWVLVRLPAMRC